MGNVAARDNAPVPHFVGRYEVLVPIASGGMATVYLARSRGAGGFERDVALKLTHLHLRESPEFQTLLVEEAKLASAIRHHNVVSVLDVGDDPLGLFLVMDYVEGDTFSGLLRRGQASTVPMPQRVAMHILLDALAGLHAAHETHDAEGKPLNIVHRDFSPQNILVGTDGIAKLTDFGIAKAASRVGHTNAGVLKGKIAYMSPEQARGVPLDRRVDVWAAGVLAWEIVTGRALWPREAEDLTTLMKLVTEVPPRLKTIDASVSDALDEAVAKALTVNPEERWPTAAAFAKAIASAAPRAETEEVAAYVRASVGPKLEKRREQVRALGTLRGKFDEITEVSEFTPSGSQVRAPSETELLASAPTPPEGAEQGGEPLVSKVSELSSPDARTTVPEEVPMHRGPPQWAVPLVAGVTGLGVLVLLVAAVMHHGGDGAKANTVHTAPAVTATTAPLTPTATVTEVIPPAPPVDIIAVTPTATVTATAPATATATTTAARSSAVVVTATATATKTAPTATVARPKPTTTTKLAPNPF